jgi:hypothetical protein
MRIRADIVGFVNDCEFRVQGRGRIDPRSGHASIELRYSRCPPDWTPLNYSDPFVLLAGYRELDGGMNFSSLATGGFHAESTITFGGGLALRKVATVRVRKGELVANYGIMGTARVGHIRGISPYEEFLHPVGEGQLLGVGLATWTTAGDPVQALVSTRYWFDQRKRIVVRPEVRGFRVKAQVSRDRLLYKARYETYVKSLST